jgi:glycosyltransferase involved in cell wall biosynthesis
MEEKFVSVVIPCYNEEKNIDRTLDQLVELADQHPYKFEIIVVNDGSLDDSWQVIKRYAEKYPQVVGVNEATNYGQSASYQAGFDLAKGEYILIVSADLEIPVENVAKVIEHLDQGYDFVNTHRKTQSGEGRGGSKVRSAIANRIISRISKIDIKDRGSGLKGFRRLYVKKLNLYGDMHRFIPDYLSVYGAKMVEFKVEYNKREYGQSAYAKQNRTIKVFLDLLTLSFMLNFSRKPFWLMPGRFFGVSGIVVSGIGTVMGIYLVWLKLFLGEDIGNRPLLTLAVVMMIIGYLIGYQSIMTGLLGELMLRIYFESSDRKTYMIREIVE